MYRPSAADSSLEEDEVVQPGKSFAWCACGSLVNGVSQILATPHLLPGCDEEYGNGGRANLEYETRAILTCQRCQRQCNAIGQSTIREREAEYKRTHLSLERERKVKKLTIGYSVALHWAAFKKKRANLTTSVSDTAKH